METSSPQDAIGSAVAATEEHTAKEFADSAPPARGADAAPLAPGGGEISEAAPTEDRQQQQQPRDGEASTSAQIRIEEPPAGPPERFIPMLDVHFEITPLRGEHASPLDEEIPGANDAHVANLVRELSDPHSLLSMRIKEDMEKAVAAETVPKSIVVEPKVREKIDFSYRPTLQSVLQLKAEPKDTGGAYMMKGPTPAEAPFLGFRHEMTGTKAITIGDTSLPGKYQPYCYETAQPYGRTDPSPERPTGAYRSMPADEDGRRAFTVVRALPAEALQLPTAGRERNSDATAAAAAAER